MSDDSFDATAAVGTSGHARVVAVLTAVSLTLALWLPMLGGAESGGSHAGALADGDGTLVAYVLSGAGLILLGAFAVPERSHGMAFAGGAAGALCGSFVFIAAAVLALYGDFKNFAKISPGAGFYMVCLSCIGCVTLFVMGIAQRPRGAALHNGPYSPIGMISAAGMTLGAMMPPGDTMSFEDLNFSWEVWYLQVAWLVFVAALGLPGFIGFAIRTVWGVRLALGALLPTLWLVLTVLVEGASTSRFAYTFNQIHPVFVIAVLGQIGALCSARRRSGAA